MFLAWNEIKQNKLRFALVIGVLLLVAYLVFFLSGLANGLKTMNRAAVDKWDGDGIILTKESDMNLQQSSFKNDEVTKKNGVKYAQLGALNTIATSGEDSKGVALFGIDPDEFIMPKVTEGKAFAADGEVIAADSLRDDGFKLGDTLKLSSTDETLKITGFTDNAKFNAAPVLYGSLTTYQKVRFSGGWKQNKDRINGYVVRTKTLDKVTAPKQLEVISNQSFIQNLPGYKEQNLTLNFMIYFLFAISAFIVAIFLYVLTIQKVSIFGVLKAEGLSSSFLARSVVVQTAILALTGILIGFGLTVLTGLFLPPAVPVAFNYLDMLLYGTVLFAVSLLGAVFSVLTIVRINPLKAIGG
ncbi:ABC transporter permease [Aciduricibacillus chroicocephali]|uniref:Putative hemin transport system permease protein HrtB n=1 Tax=Aciduricibacillus chroicocephali TaxID=3054939 RepID=A0ABY9KUJ4_9BACI|nr:ABC transporter permease [Bacillaceae bacterium 44XB]